MERLLLARVSEDDAAERDILEGGAAQDGLREVEIFEEASLERGGREVGKLEGAVDELDAVEARARQVRLAQRAALEMTFLRTGFTGRDPAQVRILEVDTPKTLLERVPGETVARRRVTSMPLSRGMAMSTRATSGRTCEAT
jgi:hypothetical protein